MSNANSIVVKGQSNVFTELSQFAVSTNLQAIKGGNGDPPTEFVVDNVNI